MARFTLIELHLDDAQFTANAPFSGEKSSGGVGETLEERLESESGSTGSRSSSAMSVLLGLVAIVGFVAVARRILSGDGTSTEERELEERLLAD